MLLVLFLLLFIPCGLGQARAREFSCSDATSYECQSPFDKAFFARRGVGSGKFHWEAASFGDSKIKNLVIQVWVRDHDATILIFFFSFFFVFLS